MPETIYKELKDIPVSEFPEEIKEVVNKSHDSGTDQYLDKGGVNEVSAAHIKEVVDAYQVAKSEPDPYGVIDESETNTKLKAWQQRLAKAGEAVKNNLLYTENPRLETSTINEWRRKNAVTGGSGSFCGCALRPDKSIVFAPYASSDVGILSANSMFRRDIKHNCGATAFLDCAYWAEKDVTIFSPWTPQNICRLNPDDTFEVIVNHGQGIYAYNACAQRYDGKMVFTPYNAPAVGMLNEDYTFAILEPHGKPDAAFRGKPVQRADGTMVFAPYYASADIMILNTDNSIRFVSSGLTMSHRCRGAILRPDNVVVFLPSGNNPHIMLLHPDDKVELILNQAWYDGNPNDGLVDGYSGCMLLPNGDVLFVTGYQGNYGVFHMDNTFSYFPSGMAAYGFCGGACNADSKPQLAPHVNAYGEVLNIDFRYKFDLEFLIRN